MCLNAYVLKCVCVCVCVCACVCVNIDPFSLFILTFPNMFFTFSSRHLTPSCLLSLLPPTPTLALGRLRHSRGNGIDDAGAAALAGAVANLTSLRELNLG